MVKYKENSGNGMSNHETEESILFFLTGKG